MVIFCVVGYVWNLSLWWAPWYYPLMFNIKALEVHFILLLFLIVCACMYVCMHMCVCAHTCTHMHAGACRGQKRTLKILAMLQAVVSSQMWVLGFELQSSARAASAPKLPSFLFNPKISVLLWCPTKLQKCVPCNLLPLCFKWSLEVWMYSCGHRRVFF